MENIQSILDDNKEQLPSGVYLELSNALMAAHKTENSGFYEVGYLYPKVEYDEDDFFEVNLRFQKVIVKLNEKQYEKLNSRLNNYLCSGVHFCSDSEEEEFEVPLPDENRVQNIHVSPCDGEVHRNEGGIVVTMLTRCQIIAIKKIEI